jgi:SAM-dependent methyltransferase
MVGSAADRAVLGQAFDAAAPRYDGARPGYPAAVFDDLATLAGLVPGARVLELGAGTGTATVPLAARGYTVVAIELGPRLAAVARQNLAAYPRAEVVCAAFEVWPLPDSPFAAVVAATAFAWIDPAVRVVRSAAARAAHAERPPAGTRVRPGEGPDRRGEGPNVPGTAIARGGTTGPSVAPGARQRIQEWQRVRL